MQQSPIISVLHVRNNFIRQRVTVKSAIVVVGVDVHTFIEGNRAEENKLLVRGCCISIYRVGQKNWHNVLYANNFIKY